MQLSKHTVAAKLLQVEDAR